MEVVVLPIILLPIFIVMTSSMKFSPWQPNDRNNDVIFNDDEQNEMIPRENMKYGNPFRGNDKDSDYEYYWSFLPQPEDQDYSNFPDIEKKHGHAETSLCMSIPGNKIFNEETGFDFKPDALREYNCEPVPSRVYKNWEHLQENATVCKVRGSCHTHEREIRVFKKERNSNRNANCWQKANYNLKVGCLCLNHFFH